MDLGDAPLMFLAESGGQFAAAIAQPAHDDPRRGRDDPQTEFM